MDLDQLLRDAVTLGAVLNPLDTVPLFLAIGRGRSAEALAVLARRSFAVGAELLLVAMDIDLGSFKVAGGLVLFLFALQMIFGGGDPADDAGQSVEQGRDLAVYPLAIPSIASPGAMTAALVLTDDHKVSVAMQCWLIVVMLGWLAVTWLVLANAARIRRVLGDSGIDVVSRVFGLFLAALSVELVVDGVRRLLA
ncbi:MAG: MarC family protein [Gemmatimonadaceae bacterium]|nr:MarC family protein [Gemmatimonadaceae bacterium]